MLLQQRASASWPRGGVGPEPCWWTSLPRGRFACAALASGCFRPSSNLYNVARGFSRSQIPEQTRTNAFSTRIVLTGGPPRRRPGRMSALAASGVPRLVAQPSDAQRSMHMQSAPLYKPLGAQRRPIHTLAAHAEVARPLVGSVQLDPAATNFVRPDVPPLSDDEGAAGRDSKAATLPARVFGGNQSFATNAKFRSALEQVRVSMTRCQHHFLAYF